MSDMEVLLDAYEKHPARYQYAIAQVEKINSRLHEISLERYKLQNEYTRLEDEITKAHREFLENAS